MNNKIIIAGITATIVAASLTGCGHTETNYWQELSAIQSIEQAEINGDITISFNYDVFSDMKNSIVPEGLFPISISYETSKNGMNSQTAFNANLDNAGEISGQIIVADGSVYVSKSVYETSKKAVSNIMSKISDDYAEYIDTDSILPDPDQIEAEYISITGGDIVDMPMTVNVNFSDTLTALAELSKEYDTTILSSKKSTSTLTLSPDTIQSEFVALHKAAAKNPDKVEQLLINVKTAILNDTASVFAETAEEVTSGLEPVFDSVINVIMDNSNSELSMDNIDDYTGSIFTSSITKNGDSYELTGEFTIAHEGTEFITIAYNQTITEAIETDITVPDSVISLEDMYSLVQIPGLTDSSLLTSDYDIYDEDYSAYDESDADYYEVNNIGLDDSDNNTDDISGLLHDLSDEELGILKDAGITDLGDVELDDESLKELQSLMSE